ncbi:MAG: glycosyltransferase family 4 protein [Deltaproteobacteria bacterium]|nr:glycosyltransferase family 4 protein [Deltaproteobacteria bacterium]MBW2331896.1 glycosyltransferase family 4 protein [Deltaproteobacteria bacterium]
MANLEFDSLSGLVFQLYGRIGVLGKVKVIHIITRFDKGGSAENTLLTVRGLDKKRYDIILIKGLSLESEMGVRETRVVEHNLAEVERCGIRTLTISELVRKIHPLYDLKAFVSLVKIFLKENPHIVHTHTSKAGILGRWAAFFARVPIIVHTPHGHVFWGYFSRWKTLVFVLLERLTAHITDKIITLTEQEKRDHLRYNIASEDKFLHVHSGVDLNKFFNVSVDPSEMKRNLGIPDNAFVVGTAGRLTPVKGHRYLIKAAKEIVAIKPDIKFLFLGEGELQEELEKMASELNIRENIVFLGWRPDVAEVMSMFDIFALPSLNEGMGRVLVEAMALAKPIVASNIGGIPNLIMQGKNGLLVPVADAKALASGIEFLMTNPKKRGEMGSAGKKIAADYSVDSMMQKIDQLYLELLKKKNVL